MKRSARRSTAASFVRESEPARLRTRDAAAGRVVGGRRDFGRFAVLSRAHDHNAPPVARGPAERRALATLRRATAWPPCRRRRAGRRGGVGPRGSSRRARRRPIVRQPSVGPMRSARTGCDRLVRGCRIVAHLQSQNLQDRGTRPDFVSAGHMGHAVGQQKPAAAAGPANTSSSVGQPHEGRVGKLAADI